MRRTTVFLDDQADSDLQVLAQRQKRPVAALVREAVEQYVAGHRSDPLSALGFVAVGRSGRQDIADRHESLLWADPHETSGRARTRAARRKRRPR